MLNQKHDLYCFHNFTYIMKVHRKQHHVHVCAQHLFWIPVIQGLDEIMSDINNNTTGLHFLPSYYKISP